MHSENQVKFFSYTKNPVSLLNFTLWFFLIDVSKMLGCKCQLLPRTVRDIKFIVPLKAFATNQCTTANIILKMKGPYSVLKLVLEGEGHYLMTLSICKILETAMDK
jgi:hypothetical protein